MRFRARIALGALVFLSAATLGFADGEKNAPPGSPNPSNATSPATVTPALPAVSSAPPPSQQTATSSETPMEAPSWDPMPASSGNPGLLTLETGETLSKGSFDIVGGVGKISRMPGTVTVLQVQPAFAVGLTNWLSFSFEFDAWNHIHVDTPAELSLAPVNSLNPQYMNTIYPSVLPATGFPPAYVEDFPFAASNHGGVGEIDLGFKLGLLSERRGNWMSFSVSNNFFIPTERGYASLISNQVQNGRFSYEVGLQASKALMHHSVVAVMNASYQILPSTTFTVAGVSTGLLLQQANQLQVGAGFLMFPDKRINVISEYDGLVFVGKAIPNTTFGARDPVDSVYGIRLYAAKHLALDVGYRYTLNLSSDKDRNGFVVKLAVASWRKKPSPPQQADHVFAACSVNPSSVAAGSANLVEVTANASDTAGRPLTFAWTASGGAVTGTGPFVRWDHAGVAPGTYTLSARVDNGAGLTTSCSTEVTVTP